MELTYPSRNAALFAAGLVLAWASVGVILRAVGIAELAIYYTLMYVSFLGVVELASPHELRPPLRRWLNVTVAIGFLGWVVSLLVYFNR